jgi:diguanylate cyclase (GGDEF)-like protein
MFCGSEVNSERRRLAEGIESMFMLNKQSTYPLVVPAALISLSALLLWKWPMVTELMAAGRELRAFFMILPIMPYAFFVIGVILGWRFNNAGIVYTALVLGLAYFAISNQGSSLSQEWTIGPGYPEAIGFLLPINVAFFTVLTGRRIFTVTGLLCMVGVLCQAFLIILLCHHSGSPFSDLITAAKANYSSIGQVVSNFSIRLRAILHSSSILGFWGVPTLLIGSFFGAFIFLGLRYLKYRDNLTAGFLATLVAAFLGTIGNYSGPSPMVYFAAAGLILIITTIDSSLSMAYIDELTGLQGRRSLNEALLNLGRRYTIAMVDIDHFKKFNDKYGHKTGDQVLKMIAAQLKKLSGGAKVYRYGGEEFTAIFPGKSLRESLPHLEVYRQTIEEKHFFIRGKGRWKGKAEDRGKRPPSSRKATKITVSIGVAESGQRLGDPEMVLKAADKILYKAKKKGRNRVES